MIKETNSQRGGNQIPCPFLLFYIVYGNPKVYHLVIEKCTTFQLSAKLDLIQ